MLQSKFRKNAIRRLSPEENYNEMFALIPRRSWLALAAVAVIIIAALAWAVFGTIKKEVPAQGVVFSSLGTATVAAFWPGEVTTFHAEPGEAVAEGEMLLSVLPEKYAVRIKNLEARLALLQGDASGNEEERRSLKGELAELKRKAQPFSIITSPASAEVVTWLFEVGDFVQQGDELAHLALRDIKRPDEKAVMLFIPAADAADVRPGQKVILTVGIADDGQMPVKYTGEVSSVSRYPLQVDDVERLVSSASQREALRSSPMFTVHCRVITPLQSADADAQPGVPGLAYPSGTRVQAAIVTEQRRPISLLIP